jgi:hypothetical protein
MFYTAARRVRQDSGSHYLDAYGVQGHRCHEHVIGNKY